MKSHWLHSKHLPEPKFWSYFALESLSQVKIVFHGLFLQYVYQLQFGEKCSNSNFRKIISLLQGSVKCYIVELFAPSLIEFTINDKMVLCDFMQVLEIVTISEKRNNPLTRAVYFFCKVCNLIIV